jgi:hypothetical protein
VNAAGAFDKKTGNIINLWKNHLHNTESKLWKKLKENDGIVNTVVGWVMKVMRTYMTKEVDLSAKRSRKQKAESNEIWEPEEEMKHKKLIIDFKVEVGGTITNAS